ncbi:TPA: hypothetical protein IGZ64_001085 [Escherichia coli]|nr:hypothetical protein [Escherichia coli]
MQAILTVFPQHSARVLLLKSGALTRMFRDGQRILITEVPQQLENAPVGEVSGQGQWLSMDPALASFFTESRVINAAGGQDGLRTWISRLPECQDTKGDHVQNLTTAQTKDGGTIRLCHACDNRYCQQKPCGVDCGLCPYEPQAECRASVDATRIILLGSDKRSD